jgi:hypothetical protein
MYGTTDRQRALELVSRPHELAFTPRKAVDRVVDDRPPDTGSGANAGLDAIRKAAFGELARLSLTERVAGEPLDGLSGISLLAIGDERSPKVDDLQRLSLTSLNGCD